MDNDDKIKKHFLETNTLFSEILKNINSEQNKTEENNKITDKLLEHLEQINQEIRGIKNEIGLLMEKKIQKKAQGDIILPLSTVKKLGECIEMDVQQTKKDVEEQDKHINTFKGKLKSIIGYSVQIKK